MHDKTFGREKPYQSPTTKKRNPSVIHVQNHNRTNSIHQTKLLLHSSTAKKKNPSTHFWQPHYRKPHRDTPQTTSPVSKSHLQKLKITEILSLLGQYPNGIVCMNQPLLPHTWTNSRPIWPGPAPNEKCNINIGRRCKTTRPLVSATYSTDTDTDTLFAVGPKLKLSIPP